MTKVNQLFAALLVATAVMTGCAGPTQSVQTPPASAKTSVADVARVISERATAGDRTYFEAVVPDAKTVPDIIRQVKASGIATNYADHLTQESSSTAVLDYHLKGDGPVALLFVVNLKLADEGWAVDSIWNAW